ncbi:hypothetical protein [Pantoea sp. OXWO6B1]|uniref:hypothetical protein n=1 Tax=Pantoea sp. OXWO6B1 TaxID=1835724 RepID=UPI000A7DABD9|nr:hypothetical protein [Pantoea sp. OXWO6B1]
MSVARTGRAETARRLASETFSELNDWTPLRLATRVPAWSWLKLSTAWRTQPSQR